MFGEERGGGGDVYSAVRRAWGERLGGGPRNRVVNRADQQQNNLDGGRDDAAAQKARNHWWGEKKRKGREFNVNMRKDGGESQAERTERKGAPRRRRGRPQLGQHVAAVGARPRG